MAFDTLVPPAGAKFSPGTSQDHEPRVNTAGFGDGYEQRTGDGLNADLASLNPRWEVLTVAEGQVLFDFFKDRKGYIPFKFALPGESPRKWIAKKWSRSFDGIMTVTISALFKEVADAE